MITLRDYQQNAVDSIRQSYAQQRRAPLLVLPTGGGKTTIFAYITQQAASKGKCVFLLCHRAELVKQISTTLANFGCHHQVIAPHAIVNQCRNSQFLELGESFIAPCRVYVASVQTLVKRMDKIIHTPDIIVIDEAHHLTQGSTWGKVIDAYPKARLLPVTATPCRLDGKGLGVDDGGYADDIIIGQTMGNLIANKYLSEYRIFCPPNALDLSNVKTRMGDYSKDDLAESMDKPTITGDAVMHYRKLCNNRRAVVFCVTVAHAEHVRDSFNAEGIASESLDGTLEPNERDARIKRFEIGLTLVLTSCDVVSEGFDLPSIECAILLRPTKSLSLYLQQVGRALRVTKGKTEAIILDHVGAAMRHGLPDTDREWTLEGRKKKPRKNDNDEPDVNIKTCPSCYAVHDSKLKQCPVCNHVYVVVKTQIQVMDGELVELDKAQVILQRKTEVKNARDFDSLVALGRSRQYKYPEQWAAKQIEIRGQYAKRRN